MRYGGLTEKTKANQNKLSSTAKSKENTINYNKNKYIRKQRAKLIGRHEKSKNVWVRTAKQTQKQIKEEENELQNPQKQVITRIKKKAQQIS